MPSNLFKNSLNGDKTILNMKSQRVSELIGKTFEVW